jgi:hypothetical protein
VPHEDHLCAPACVCVCVCARVMRRWCGRAAAEARAHEGLGGSTCGHQARCVLQVHQPPASTSLQLRPPPHRMDPEP